LLRTYALLHFNSLKTKNITEYKDFTTDKIFELKRNEEKLKSITDLLKSQKNIKRKGKNSRDDYNNTKN
jgi:hypothetical protein